MTCHQAHGRGEVVVGQRVRYEGRDWIVTATLPLRAYDWTALTIWRLDSGDRHIRDLDLEAQP